MPFPDQLADQTSADHRGLTEDQLQQLLDFVSAGGPKAEEGPGAGSRSAAWTDIQVI